MTRRFWTREEELLLARLIADGVSHPDIAVLLDRTVYAIGNRAQKLGFRNPEAAQANSHQAFRDRLADPVYRARYSQASKAAWSDERRAKQSAVAKRVNAKVGFRPPTPEGRARISRGCSNWHKRRWAWLPEDRREEYRKLMRKIGAAAAKIHIMDTMAPFERQLAKVRMGAPLVEVRPIVRRLPDRTLGGVVGAIA